MTSIEVTQARTKKLRSNIIRLSVCVKYGATTILYVNGFQNKLSSCFRPLYMY